MEETNNLLKQILVQLKTMNEEHKEYMEQGVWLLEDRLIKMEIVLDSIEDLNKNICRSM